MGYVAGALLGVALAVSTMDKYEYLCVPTEVVDAQYLEYKVVTAYEEDTTCFRVSP